jgi:hypothetical protein
MKSGLIFALVLSFVALYGRAEEPVPILASGSTLTLSDGRTFNNWKIKRQTAANVFILSPTGIATIDKRALPADLRAQFPYDSAAVAREAADLAASDAAGKARVAELETKRKAAYDKRVARAARDVKEEKLQAAHAKERQRTRELTDARQDSRDGFFLGWKAVSIQGNAVTVEIWNTTEETKTFDWRGITARFRDLKTAAPKSASDSKSGGNFVMGPLETRAFRLEFDRSDAPDVIAWKSGDWRQDASLVHEWVQGEINPAFQR